MCEPCASDGDCDFNEVCADFGTGAYCTAFCDWETCPGDSRCYEANAGTQTVYICLNPGADVALCPASYSCGSVRTCNGLGNDCANPANCSVDTEVCLQDGAGSAICSCFCNGNGDCGSGNSCVSLSDGRTACVPGQVSNPCDGVSCPPGQTCNPSTGQCAGGGGGCSGLGEDCSWGVSFCSSGDICLDDGTNVFCSCTCTSDGDCGNGTCESVGSGTYACVPGGSSGDLCANVQCPPGATCSPATGTCIGAEDFGFTDTSSGGTDTRITTTDTSGIPDFLNYDMGHVGSDTRVSLNDTGRPGKTDATGEGCSCRVGATSRLSPFGLTALLALGAALFVRSRRRS